MYSGGAFRPIVIQESSVKKKIIAAIAVIVLLFSSCSAAPAAKVDTDNFKTNYKYIFVHGLSGWGSYDTANKFVKYWGVQNGDLLKYLNEAGFDCYAASVAPTGSAWDRACELYAQLTGSVTDYGEEHSKRCNHGRYGPDFTKKPLIDKWDSENKINLLGHSFGGATVRLLAELMANGSKAEQSAAKKEELSPLFEGGKGDWIYSITALAAPHNGTSAYNAGDAADVDDELTFKQKMMSGIVSGASGDKKDDRIDSDYASHDLQIDRALELNKSISTLENTYYFSFPCSSTDKAEDGTYRPDDKITETMFIKSARLMGLCTGKTDGGFEITEEWLENDGLVNVISARAPFDAPQKEFEEGNVKTGEWNIMPTYRGDHMSLQGGFFKKNSDVKAFYIKHLTMINSL